MLWMLVTVNKKKHMAWHGSHVSKIISSKILVAQTFFDVLNEIRLTLVTRILGNESKCVYKKTFGGLSKSNDQGKEKKKRMAIAKFFALHANAIIKACCDDIKKGFITKSGVSFFW